MLSYWVDDQNIICQVDDSWDKSMDVKSWSDRACSKGIIGKPLFDFICDDVTRMYVATMIQSVRIIPHTSFRPYRCDSPDAKRYLQMIITPEDNGWVRISHEILRTEPLLHSVRFVPRMPNLESERASIKSRYIAIYKDNGGFLRCSICNRLLDLNKNSWQEVDQLLDQNNTVLQPIQVSYHVCPDCQQDNL